MFSISYHPKVLSKDVQTISQEDLKRIRIILEKKLTASPQIFGKPLRNTLKNFRSLRVGKYRIGYEIQEQKLLVQVIKIGLREQIYQSMKKRLGV